MIKHISFDLWLTLIKSHPKFKRKRAELIAQNYCDKDFTAAAEIDTLIRKIDKQIDKNNEATGTKMPATEMYYTILQHTCIESDDLMMKAEKLKDESNLLFQQYMPLILNDNIIDMLSQLKADGYTLNLSSNTGFIEGETLRVVLDKMGILQFFSFLIFSDEVKASKPSKHFFEEIDKQLNISKNEVLHIGDNKLTDYKGATDFGYNTLLITNNNYSINDLKKSL